MLKSLIGSSSKETLTTGKNRVQQRLEEVTKPEDPIERGIRLAKERVERLGQTAVLPADNIQQLQERAGVEPVTGKKKAPPLPPLERVIEGPIGTPPIKPILKTS